MNYYERHLGDYAKDTGHLSMLEHGAYSLLLDRYYSTEKGIPEVIAHRIARAKSKDEKKAVDFVLSEFFVLENGVWINGRAEEEIIVAKKKIHAAQENGKKGGRPKLEEKHNEINDCVKPAGLLLGSENETQKKAHQTPDTIKEPPIPPKGGNAEIRNQPVSLKTFLANCKEKGEKAIPENDPVFDFADKAGIPDEWLRLAWREFVDRYDDGRKRYRDWRKTFRNAVRGNWFKVWYCAEDGKMALSSQGRVLDLAHKVAA